MLKELHRSVYLMHVPTEIPGSQEFAHMESGMCENISGRTFCPDSVTKTIELTWKQRLFLLLKWMLFVLIRCSGREGIRSKTNLFCRNDWSVYSTV